MDSKVIFYVAAFILTALVLFAISFAISSFVDKEVVAGIGCILSAIIAGYADYLLISRQCKNSE